MSSEPPPGGSLSPSSDQPSPSAEIAVERRLTQLFASRHGPAEFPMDRAVARKMQPEHVTQLIDYLKLREQNRHTEASDRHKYEPAVGLALTLIVLFFVVVVVWLALSYGKPEVITPILAAIGGLLGGYGVGHARGVKEGRRSAEQPPPG